MRPVWIAVVYALGAMQSANCRCEARAQELAGSALYVVPDQPAGQLDRRDITLSGIEQSIDLGLGITEWLGLFKTPALSYVDLILRHIL